PLPPRASAHVSRSSSHLSSRSSLRVSSRPSPLRSLRAVLCAVACATACLNLAACVPLVLTAATAGVVDVSLDRRTPGTYWDDNALEIKLRGDIAADDALGEQVNVSVTVFNGVVLLTGEVNSDDQRQRVETLVLAYKSGGEVAHVVNELILAGKTNITSRVNDAWLTGKAKAALLNSQVPHNTVKVVTEHGKMYLLGIVTRAEAEAAVTAVRGIGGATHIVKVFEYVEPSE
ncbi:MAG: BON domain-containing protein, partial [bacterium]